MDILVKLLAVAVTGSVLGLVIKKNSPEMALMLTVALAIFTVVLSAQIISEILAFVKSVSEAAGISASVLAIVLKTVGVAIVTKISADICRDAGQASVASSVEFAGSAVAVYAALPLFKTVVSMIDSLL